MQLVSRRVFLRDGFRPWPAVSKITGSRKPPIREGLPVIPRHDPPSRFRVAYWICIFLNCAPDIWPKATTLLALPQVVMLHLAYSWCWLIYIPIQTSQPTNTSLHWSWRSKFDNVWCFPIAHIYRAVLLDILDDSYELWTYDVSCHALSSPRLPKTDTLKHSLNPARLDSRQMPGHTFSSDEYDPPETPLSKDDLQSPTFSFIRIRTIHFNHPMPRSELTTQLRHPMGQFVSHQGRLNLE
jgi:hypothetical protein